MSYEKRNRLPWIHVDEDLPHNDQVVWAKGFAVEEKAVFLKTKTGHGFFRHTDMKQIKDVDFWLACE